MGLKWTTLPISLHQVPAIEKGFRSATQSQTCWLLAYQAMDKRQERLHSWRILKLALLLACKEGPADRKSSHPHALCLLLTTNYMQWILHRSGLIWVWISEFHLRNWCQGHRGWSGPRGGGSCTASPEGGNYMKLYNQLRTKSSRLSRWTLPLKPSKQRRRVLLTTSTVGESQQGVHGA